MSRAWEDTEDKIIKSGWGSGLSASQISRKLKDRSRSAVLGRVFRLKLESRMFRAIPEGVRNMDPKTPRSVVKNFRAPEHGGKDPGPAHPPIDTMALRDRHCKWPYNTGAGDYHYCGQQPKAERPYCPYHCDKAYTAPRYRGPAA